MMRFERAFLLGFIVLAAALPLGLRDEYLLHLGVLCLFSIVLAQSFNLMVGYVGEFPLGHVVFLGIGAYTAALCATKLGLPLYATIPAGAVTAAAAGIAIGAITLRLRGPFFVIVTLCFAEVARLIANNWIGLTNGPMGIAGIPKPDWLQALAGAAQKTGFYYLALLLAVCTLYVCYRFAYSNLGRAAVTVRENRYVAQSVGIAPFRIALTTFTLGATLAGLSGAFYAYYISFVGPEVFDFSFTASTIIMVLLGGKGTLAGPVVGPILVVLMQEGLRDFKELRLSLFGAIVVAVVLFLPRGIMGFVARRPDRALPVSKASHAPRAQYS